MAMWVRVADSLKNMSLLQFLRAVIVSGGATSIYLAGFLSSVGMEFGALVSMTDLIDSTSYLWIYVVSFLVLFFLLWEVVGGLINWFEEVCFRVFNYVGWRAQDAIEIIFKIIRIFMASSITLYIIFCVLNALIGRSYSILLMILVVPLIIGLISRGTLNFLRSPISFAACFAIIFSVGGLRASYLYNRDDSFIVYGQDGANIDANIILYSRSGSLLRVRYGENEAERLRQFFALNGKIQGEIIFIPSGGISYVQPKLKSDLYSIISLSNLKYDLRIAVCENRTDFRCMASNVSSASVSVPGLVSTLAYIAGMGLAKMGKLKLKDHVDNPSRTPLSDGAAGLGSGGALSGIDLVPSESVPQEPSGTTEGD